MVRNLPIVIECRAEPRLLRDTGLGLGVPAVVHALLLAASEVAKNKVAWTALSF